MLLPNVFQTCFDRSKRVPIVVPNVVVLNILILNVVRP